MKIGPVILVLGLLAGAAAAQPDFNERDAGEAMANVFWSGHSLTDPPIPDFVAEISRSLGIEAGWNRHSMAGGSLLDRTRGRPPQENGWAGYRQGYNRDSEDMDVVTEFLNPRTIAGDHYDVLVITEVHDLLWPLLHRDTVRLLRHYHERFLEGNAAGQTFFYQAWLGLADLEDPSSWIEYERAASPVWQCVATRVNASLEFEERQDRIGFIPAGLALAELVERAVSEPGLPGISAATPGATVQGLFSDDVHLTRLGAYYIALVTHALIHGSLPSDTWRPDDIEPEQAQTLQRAATEFVAGYRNTNVPLELAECSAYMRDQFAAHYWRYEIGWRHQQTLRANGKPSWWRAGVEQAQRAMRRVRLTRAWQDSFADDAPENPFRFDPKTDRTYWHPAP
jgi:hypothetical protein